MELTKSQIKRIIESLDDSIDCNNSFLKDCDVPEDITATKNDTNELRKLIRILSDELCRRVGE